MAKRSARSKTAARKVAGPARAKARPARKSKKSVKAAGSARTSNAAVKKTAARRRTGTPARRSTADSRPTGLFAPVTGAERKDFGHVQLEVGKAGGARVKRMIYPPGFHWAVDMKPVTGTELCMHAHVGFLAHGEIHIEYADGCVVEHKAPQIVAIEPGHDGWVVGKEPVVLIEFDFERDTVSKLGMPNRHQHE
jgi:hypothetical protein